jgi:predicted transglutaminase-like cysteine proteinase
MGVWHRIIALASLSLLTQACVQHNVAKAPEATGQQTINPLKLYHPKTSLEDLDQRTAAEINGYADKALDAQCERESFAPWCNAANAKQITHRLTPVELQNISHNVFNHFVYKSDAVDSWDDYVAIVDRGQIFYGDCDDITSTTLNALERAGQPLNKMWMMLVNVESHGDLDHIIGVIQDSNGTYWVVGDTNPTNAYPLARLTYSPRAMVRLDQRHKWMSALEAPVLQNYPEKLGYAPVIH